MQRRELLKRSGAAAIALAIAAEAPQADADVRPAGTVWPLDANAEERMAIATMLAAGVVPGTQAAEAILAWFVHGEPVPADHEWAMDRCRRVLFFMEVRFSGFTWDELRADKAS